MHATLVRSVVCAALVAGCAALSPSPRDRSSSLLEREAPSSRPTHDVAVPDWVLVPPAPSLADAQLERIARLEEGFLAVGCRTDAGLDGSGPCSVPATWHSRDGVAWGRPIDLPLALGESSGLARAAAAGPVGLVVVGHTERRDGRDAAIWFSPDGSSFSRVEGGASFRDAAAVGVADARGRFVVVGAGAQGEDVGFLGWWSDDGTTWAASEGIEQTSAYPQAILGLEGRNLLAWGPSCAVCIPVTHWWATADGVDWVAEGPAPGLEDVHVTALSATNAGLLASGARGGGETGPATGQWSRPWSEDTWRASAAPVLPPGARIDRFLGIGHGTVAAAHGSPGDRSVTFVLGRGPGDERWRGLAELPDFVLVDVVQHPVELHRVVAIGHSGAGAPRAWIGQVDWAP